MAARCMALLRQAAAVYNRNTTSCPFSVLCVDGCMFCLGLMCVRSGPLQHPTILTEFRVSPEKIAQQRGKPKTWKPSVLLVCWVVTCLSRRTARPLSVGLNTFVFLLPANKRSRFYFCLSGQRVGKGIGDAVSNYYSPSLSLVQFCALELPPRWALCMWFHHGRRRCVVRDVGELSSFFLQHHPCTVIGFWYFHRPCVYASTPSGIFGLVALKYQDCGVQATCRPVTAWRIYEHSCPRLWHTSTEVSAQ